MLTRSGHPYMLGESSESGNIIIDRQQLANAIAAIQTHLANLIQTVNQTGERLGRVERVSRTTTIEKKNVIGWYHSKNTVSEILIVNT